MKPPVPYRGDEPYIFISYSHKDSRKVWPVIEQMQADGYRVWYDEGIDPGTEWDENIAAHVKNCSFFIAFMSENYLASDNCKDELNYSRDLDKQQLIIYLDKVELPPALAMRIGRHQAIMQYGLKEEDFYDKLYDAQGIELQHKDNKAPKIALERPQEVHVQTANDKKNILPLVLIAALLISAIIGGMMWFKGRGDSAETSGGNTENAQMNDTTTAAEGELKQITNVDLYDDDNLNVKALGMEKDSRYVTWNLAVQNKRDADMFLYTCTTYVNGSEFDPDWTGTLPAKEISHITVQFPIEKMEKYFIDPDNITVIETWLSGRLLDDSASIDTKTFAYYPYGEENVKMAEYVPAEDDFIILDNAEFTVAARRSEKYDETNYSGYWFPEFIVVNKTDSRKEYSVEKDNVNGYSTEFHILGTSDPHTICYNEGFYDDVRLVTEEFGKTYLYRGEFYIGEPSESWNEGDVTYPFEIYPEGEEAAKALNDREITPEQVIYEDESMIFAYLGSQSTNAGSTDIFYARNISDRTLEATVQTTRDGEAYPNTPEVILQPGDEAIFAADYLSNYIGRGDTAETTILYWDYGTSIGGSLWEEFTVELYEID